MEEEEGSGVNVAVLDQGVYKLHNDLSSNISPLSYDTQNGSSPSVFTSGRDHGTHVSGTIAAIKDNNLQVVGVAPQSEIMSISHTLSVTPNVSEELADGMNWAWQNGADVINNSWGDQGGAFYDDLHSAILENSILDAMSNGRNGLGTLVVFAAGNHSPAIDYPAYFHEDIICVGAITSSGSRSSFSGYGDELDIVAPGSSILSTIPNQGTASWDGTSMATPHVVGVIALVLSVNPSLNDLQVRTIVEQTAQKIGSYNYENTPERPNGTWNEQMGYGLVDAYAAVQLAQELYSLTLDLYVKDGFDDLGLEPNETKGVMWTSPDIWVRNQPDGIEEHQNPEYSETNPVYVYVRVTNKSEQTSSGSEQLTLNWAKASTALAWPVNWDGTLTHPDPPHPKMGDLVSIVNIPVLTAGSEAILEIPWMLPNPADYENINPEPWHFCLLSRIMTSSDPMATPEGVSVNSNTRNNNNIAWKNITITGGKENVRNPGGVVALGNIFQEPTAFDIVFNVPQPCFGPSILDVAEVKVTLDATTYQKWVNGGKQCHNITELEIKNY
jgi:serine protease